MTASTIMTRPLRVSRKTIRLTVTLSSTSLLTRYQSTPAPAIRPTTTIPLPWTLITS